MVTATANEIISEVRDRAEKQFVSIADIARGYGDWEPDLRVDPRLREKLAKLVALCRERWGGDFVLPISSCYRPFLLYEKGHWLRDASDPRGHWSGLAIDIGYRNVLGCYEDWRFFVKAAKQAGLYRIHLKKYGEWWHFSDWGAPWKRWRPTNDIAKLRGEVCKQIGIL